MKIKPRTELIKTIIIVVLMVSMVYTALNTQMVKDLLANVSFGELKLDSGVVAGRVSAAAKPEAIAVYNNSGRFATRQNDGGAAVYDSTSLFFREAFASLSSLEESTEEEWKSALVSDSVFYSYSCEIGFDTLAEWFSSSAAGADFSLRHMVLADDGGEVALFALDTSGYCRKFKTGISRESFLEHVNSYTENGAAFVFETEALKNNSAPYMLLLNDGLTPMVYVSSPMSDYEALDSILAAQNVRTLVKSSYVEADGSRIFVENDFTVRVTADYRTLEYKLSEPETRRKNETTKARQIEQCRAILDSSVGRHIGGATIEFAALVTDGSENIIDFYYRVEGENVFISSDGFAARFIVSGDLIYEYVIHVRSFETSNLGHKILPQTQAAAAAGGEVRLTYFDNGQEHLSTGWLHILQGG